MGAISSLIFCRKNSTCKESSERNGLVVFSASSIKYRERLDRAVLQLFSVIPQGATKERSVKGAIFKVLLFTYQEIQILACKKSILQSQKNT